MALPQESVNMALFCDFENVALGVRDANYEKFDITPVLERLLLKGSIVVKKAYCDWDRYKKFKAAMHEASFELIEIPHVRQTGKNSADIRLVVDALDLCYTKSHVDTFVIISGDSDFSPLVSKLRENAKKVIGVGVKNSTSDLLVANCDEFIFYDDLVREAQRAMAKRESNAANKRAASGAASEGSPDTARPAKTDMEARKAKAFAIAVETFDALVAERGDSGKIWASVLKSAIKRRKPDFNESYYGFRAFGSLLDEAQAQGLFEVGRDEKSGTFVYRQGGNAEPDSVAETAVSATESRDKESDREANRPRNNDRRGSRDKRGRRGGNETDTPQAALEMTFAPYQVGDTESSDAHRGDEDPSHPADDDTRRDLDADATHASRNAAAATHHDIPFASAAALQSDDTSTNSTLPNEASVADADPSADGDAPALAEPTKRSPARRARRAAAKHAEAVVAEVLLVEGVAGAKARGTATATPDALDTAPSAQAASEAPDTGAGVGTDAGPDSHVGADAAAAPRARPSRRTAAGARRRKAAVPVDD